METEAENNGSSQQPDLDKVLKKINEIAKKSADGDYIYRGEPAHHEEHPYYGRVTSGLYRQYLDIGAEHFDIKVVQQQILTEAREYIPDEIGDFELLATLQHYGDKTNLIDFTTDYLVALFFACDGKPRQSGRVILLPKKSKDKDYGYEVEKPSGTIRRAEIQKSIFVIAPRGFVTPDKDKVVYIPANLKLALLGYLRKHHDISTKTIYNDLHGFIEKRRLHGKAYTEFNKGFTSHRRADAAKTNTEKQKLYDDAITHYTKAIDLKPDLIEAYNNRGVAYGKTSDFDAAIQDFNAAIALDSEYANGYSNRGNAYGNTGDFDAAIADFNKAIDLDPEDAGAYNSRGNAYSDKGELDKAIQDFNKAIDLDPEDAGAYSDRGEVWLHLKEWQKAKADLTTAKNMSCDIIGSFHNDYESVEDFEAKNGVTLPKDIAALLSGNKVNDTRQKRNEQYWAAFFEALPPDKLGLKIPNIYDSHYRDLHMRITGCYIRVSQRVRPAGIAAAFVMKGSAQDFLHSLIKQQTAIENELGEKFYCHEAIQGEKQIYVALKSCDVTDKTDWSDQHQWFAMKLEKLVEVFRPRIEKLI